MNVEFQSNMWFDVTEEDKFFLIGTVTSCGNYVTIKVRKSYPYNKHLKSLVKELYKRVFGEVKMR